MERHNIYRHRYLFQNSKGFSHHIRNGGKKNNTIRMKGICMRQATNVMRSYCVVFYIMCLDEDECKWIKMKSIEFICTRFISNRVWANAHYWKINYVFIELHSPHYIYAQPSCLVYESASSPHIHWHVNHTEYLLIWDHQPQIISSDDFFCCCSLLAVLTYDFLFCVRNIRRTKVTHARHTRQTT